MGDSRARDDFAHDLRMDRRAVQLSSTVDTPERGHFWPADVHLIAKEILLVSRGDLAGHVNRHEAGIAATDLCHSFWISEGRKMSKSLGNFIDLEKSTVYC